MGRTSDAKERLIDTAVGLIRARGYASVSVDDLCRSAGVRKGSFYHFFPSKRDLALAALDAWWDATREDVLEPAFAADVPPLERIERAFRGVVEQQAHNTALMGRMQGCPIGNLAMELSAQDELVRERLHAVFGRFADFFAGALREARADGTLAAETDPDASAQALLAYLYGAILIAKTADDMDVLRGITQRALRLVCDRSA